MQKPPEVIQYKNTGKLGKGIQILLIFVIASGLLQWLTVFSLAFIGSPEGTGLRPVVDILYSAASLVRPASYIATGFCFLIWLGLSFRNLTPLNVTGMKNKEWYAIWGFFIPVACFYIPMAVVDEVWRGSDPSNLDPVEWKNNKHTPLIYAWWTCWMLHGIIGLVALFLEKDPQYSSIAHNPLLHFSGELIFSIAGILLMLIVQKISSRQEQKRALVLQNKLHHD